MTLQPDGRPVNACHPTTMTPILETLLPLVTQYAHTKARLWLEGSEELAKPDDDLASFLARQDVEWDQLEAAYQDSVRDAYIEAIRSAMQRPVQSDSYPSASDLRLLLVEARDILACSGSALDSSYFEGVAETERRYQDARDERRAVFSWKDKRDATLSKLQSIKA